MREHLRQLINEARLPRLATDGEGDRYTSLGAHVVRLAHLAAAVHRHDAVRGPSPAGTVAAREPMEARS